MALWAWLILNVISMYFAGQVAIRKGRSFKMWLWLGAIFSVFALIIVAVLPSVEKPSAA